MENGRVSKEVPHLFQLACDQGTKNRVTRGRGPEVGADLVIPGSVKAATGRVQAGVHELGEGNSPMLVNEVFDFLVNRGSHFPTFPPRFDHHPMACETLRHEAEESLAPRDDTIIADDRGL
jgi:hypothetical protein